MGLGLTRISGTEAATLPTTVDDFYYETEYKVLICKIYKRVVKSLDRHLRDAHNLRKKKERQPLLDHYARFEFTTLEDVATPPTNGPPFKALRDPILAYLCNGYTHMSTSRKAIRGHYNKKHDWRYSKGAPVYWTEVYIQSFFEGFYQQYFIIQTESALI